MQPNVHTCTWKASDGTTGQTTFESRAKTLRGLVRTALDWVYAESMFRLGPSLFGNDVTILTIDGNSI